MALPTFAVPCALGQTNAAADNAGGSASSEFIEDHMPVALRSSMNNVVVIAGQGPTDEKLTGTYEQNTSGLIGGIDEGSRMGTISKEIGGVPIFIPIPGLALPGAIFGGIAGVTKREIQEFRDALTEELVDAENSQFRSDGLANDVFWALRRVPALESQLFSPNVEIPSETDAVLYVSFNDVTIDVQGKYAVITASVNAVLRRLSDGQNVYSTNIHYRDRDTLSRWTDNDNELWRQYTNFARYYLGRAVAEDFFSRVDLDHDLFPAATASVEEDRKNPHRFITDSVLPTLAWNVRQNGLAVYPGWPSEIDEADITYEIEIFDDRQLVYDAKSLPDPEHALTYELEPCKTYRWSIRPAYHVNGVTRFGNWMRLEPEVEEDATDTLAEKKGLVGRAASVAHAYTQDFPVLEVSCAR